MDFPLNLIREYVDSNRVGNFVSLIVEVNYRWILRITSFFPGLFLFFFGLQLRDRKREKWGGVRES